MVNSKYSLQLRVLHWIMGVAIIGLLCSGLIMTEMSSQEGLKWKIYNVHKSIGLAIFFLVIIRVIARFRSHIPDLPKFINQNLKLLSKIVQYTLYIFMLVMPLSGIMMSVFAGYNLVFFEMSFSIPLEKNLGFSKLAHDIHEVSGYMMIILILLHVSGTAKHMIFDKYNILKRII